MTLLIRPIFVLWAVPPVSYIYVKRIGNFIFIFSFVSADLYLF